MHRKAQGTGVFESNWEHCYWSCDLCPLTSLLNIDHPLCLKRCSYSITNRNINCIHKNKAQVKVKKTKVIGPYVNILHFAQSSVNFGIWFWFLFFLKKMYIYIYVFVMLFKFLHLIIFRLQLSPSLSCTVTMVTGVLVYLEVRGKITVYLFTQCPRHWHSTDAWRSLNKIIKYNWNVSRYFSFTFSLVFINKYFSS